MLKFVFLAIGVARAFNNGATLSLDFGVLSQAKDVYFSYIIEALNNAQLPNIQFLNGHIGSNFFRVNLAPKNVNIQPSDSNSIILSVNDLSASFKSKDLIVNFWVVNCDGVVDAAINDMSVSVKLQLDQQSLSHGRLVPGINVLNVIVDIPENSIKLTVQGSMLAEALE